MTCQIIGFHANLSGTEKEIRSANLLVEEEGDWFVIGHPDPAKPRHKLRAEKDDPYLHLLAEDARSALMPYSQTERTGAQRVMLIGYRMAQEMRRVLPDDALTLKVLGWPVLPSTRHRAAIQIDTTFEADRFHARDGAYKQIIWAEHGGLEGDSADMADRLELFRALNPRETAGYLAKLAVLCRRLDRPEEFKQVLQRARRLEVSDAAFKARIHQEEGEAKRLTQTGPRGHRLVVEGLFQPKGRYVDTQRGPDDLVTSPSHGYDPFASRKTLTRSGKIVSRGSRSHLISNLHGLRTHILSGETYHRALELMEAAEDEVPGHWVATRVEESRVFLPFQLLVTHAPSNEDQGDVTRFSVLPTGKVSHE